MIDREKIEEMFNETLDLLDSLNTRDGRFEYADYVALHNNITALYDSFAHTLKKAKEEDRLVILPCKPRDKVYVLHGYYTKRIVEDTVKHVCVCDGEVHLIMVETGKKVWERSAFATRADAKRALNE